MKYLKPTPPPPKKNYKDPFRNFISHKSEINLMLHVGQNNVW